MSILEKRNLSPIKRLIELAIDDKHDLGVLMTYNLIAGLLTLVIPLGTQALINTIAAGVFVQPLFILTLLVLGGLLLYTMFQIIQLNIIETLQQRIFAKIAFRLATHIPKIKESELQDRYGPEIVNRFFDTMTLQKSWAKLLLQGPASIFQIIIGLVLLAIYSPYLFMFSLFIVLSIYVLVKMGYRGIDTSIDESTQKYKVAHWLEELARCHLSFKLSSTYDFLLHKTDDRVVDYISARKKHFKVILRQYLTYYIFYSLAITGLLSIGGWLVIDQKLGLGQLVAAEIVMLNILKASENIITRLEAYYDLVTSIDKLGYITDLETERNDGEALPRNNAGIEIRCANLNFSYINNLPILKELNLHIKSGQRVSLVGKSGAGKTTLASLLIGLHEPQSGLITADGIDIRDYHLDDLRTQVALVSNSNEIFEGTVEENITLGSENADKVLLQEVLDIVELNKDLSKMKDGIKTKLTSEGLSISLGQRLRILIARALLKKPRLLILDESFIGTDEKTKLNIIDNILDRSNNWTVIDISHDAESVVKSDVIHVLKNGKIIESGEPIVLAQNTKSYFAKLFPELSRQIQQKIV